MLMLVDCPLLLKTMEAVDPHFAVSNGHTMYCITESLIEDEQVHEEFDAWEQVESSQQIEVGSCEELSTY